MEFLKNNSKIKYTIILLVLVSGFAMACSPVPNKDLEEDENLNTVGKIKEPYGVENQDINSIEEVEVVFNKDNAYWNDVNPISIRDKKIINDILNMIGESKIPKDMEKIKDMSGMSYKNNKIITRKVHGEKTEISFTFDTLYEIGFIEINGEKLEPKYDFFRYMLDLVEYGEYDTNIDKEVVELFQEYNWTIDYKVNSIEERLPWDLKHSPGEHPIKLYWAYNNELSKSIGLDFSNYLGDDIEAEIYRLREPLPEYMHPGLDARGIVIKKDGKIIGAYIDAGRHNSFACSLDRKGLKDITSKDWNRWVQDYIDYEDELERELAKLSPEEIIKTYFEALDSQDIKKAKACLSRTESNVGLDLAVNMNNKELYNKKNHDYFNNIKSAKLLEVEEFNTEDLNPNLLWYKVKVDLKFKKFITSEDGVMPYIVNMGKESEKGKWGIEDIGF